MAIEDALKLLAEQDIADPISVGEAKRRLGISEATFYKYRSRGFIKAPQGTRGRAFYSAAYIESIRKTVQYEAHYNLENRGAFGRPGRGAMERAWHSRRLKYGPSGRR